MIQMRELDSIRNFYGVRIAERSKVPLIYHIVEGLAVLCHIGASRAARQAYCLHPIFQSDDALRKGYCSSYMENTDPATMLLVMEYRNQANAWLSDKVKKDVHWAAPGAQTQVTYVLTGRPSPGPLSEVRDMLIADKVQNYKDFKKYHYGTHDRSDELDLYFKTWFEALGIGDNLESLIQVAAAVYAKN